MLITKDILLIELEEKEGYNINDKFRNRLKDRIYIWYVDGDFYYLNLCVTEDVLEKIYIRNVYYVKNKIITLNML